MDQRAFGGRGNGAGGTGTALSPGDALTGRLLEGRYQVSTPIARGGMATVYVALDIRLEREVAVKVMHPALAQDEQFVARFQREAKAAARINHPNVVTVNDTGEDGGLVFLVMELVRGRTLRALLTERGRLTPSQSLDILQPVLSALKAAHSAGLVHRDVKPENVLLADNGAVKVADFGLARAVESSSLTLHGGLLLGTVAYLAPEQVTQGTADARSDVYAAGVLLYEMVAGAVPFTAETPMAVAYRHVHENVPAASSTVPGIPPALDDLIAGATARDPADRYPSAELFAVAARRVQRLLTLAPARTGDTTALLMGDHVTQLIGTTAVPSTAKPAADRPRGRRRRWPLLLALLLLLASVGAGLTGWLLGSNNDVRVPALVGSSLTAAEAVIRLHHLTPVVGSAVNSDTVAAGLVASTSPVANSRVHRGAQITVHVSRGVLKVTVPTLQGQSLNAADAALAHVSLPTGTVTSAYSDTVKAGLVINSTPPAGSIVDHRTKINLVVSKGPAPIPIPNETGRPQQLATSTLRDLGLMVTVTQAFSDTVTTGQVISQTPNGGTGHRGETVALVVSKGPQLVTVPNLQGLTAARAREELAALGLRSNEFDLFGGSGHVIDQNPSPGSQVKPGSTVTFTTA